MEVNNLQDMPALLAYMIHYVRKPTPAGCKSAGLLLPADISGQLKPSLKDHAHQVEHAAHLSEPSSFTIIITSSSLAVYCTTPVNACVYLAINLRKLHARQASKLAS